jgi:hypothetical protein
MWPHHLGRVWGEATAAAWTEPAARTARMTEVAFILMVLDWKIGLEREILRKLDDGDVWRKEPEKSNCFEVYIFVKTRYHRWFNDSLVIEKNMLGVSSKILVTLNRGMILNRILCRSSPPRIEVLFSVLRSE